jgi:AcrR family transcriptional regulator
METGQRISVAMTELMRRQGYAATGIGALARASGAPTGSIYHHFPGGKRAVAEVALREAGAAYLALLPLLLDPYADLVTGVEAAFATAAQNMADTGWLTMCPVATVAAEVADTEPGLRAVAAEVMTTWIDEGARYLEGRGLREEDARATVLALLTALEGAFLLARTLRTPEPFHAAGRALAASVAVLPVNGSRSAARPG